MRFEGAIAPAPRSAARTIGAPGRDCHPPRPEGAEESVRTAPPLLPTVSIATASCHSPGPGGLRTAGEVPAARWVGAATPARSGGVRDIGRRRVAPTPFAVTVRGDVPGGGCHPRPGHPGGVRNAHLHGCHHARAELMGHAPGRCGICQLVEPLGLRHVPNGMRNPSGPVTIRGDRCHDLAERLWPKIAGPWASTPEREIGHEDCWLWDGAQGEFDYGRISAGRRGEGLIGPHRAVLELMDQASYLPGTAPDRSDLVACHNCPGGDNPLCCNPSHLFWGTHAENSRDMVRKGRHRTGGRSRPTVDRQAYARYLEERAMLEEVERYGPEAAAELRTDWCTGYDAGQAGQARADEPSAHYQYGYRAGVADRERGIELCLAGADRGEGELEVER
jgi:hypothetical protein